MPCCHLRLRANKSTPYRHPGQANGLDALGDRLKARRLELGLRQVDAARKVGVAHKTFAHWEQGVRLPAVLHWPAIDAFLGYCLYERAATFGDRIRLHREHRGLSHRELAELLGAQAGSVSRWESGARVPEKAWRARLEEWFGEDSRAG